YDTGGFLTGIVDRNGLTTSIQRDSGERATAIVAPSGQRTVLTMGGDGYLASVLTPGGASRSFSYSNGLLTTETDEAGGLHQFAYDDSGRLLSDTGSAGDSWTLSSQRVASGNVQISATTAAGRATLYDIATSDGAESTTTTLPTGLVETRTVDSAHDSHLSLPDGTEINNVASPDPRFGMAAPYVSAHTVTTPGNLILSAVASKAVTVASDGVTLLAANDAATINGRTTTRTYDAGSRTTTTTLPSGRQRIVREDEHGRLTYSQFGGLAPTVNSYDARGRLQSVTVGTGADARTTSFTYDGLDRPVSSVDPRSLTDGFGYDADNRSVVRTTPDGAQTVLSYDPAGDLVSVAPPGRPAHQFVFSSGREESSYAAPAVPGVASSTTSYSYNLDRQLTLITRPDGETIAVGYDAAGRLSTTTYDAGTVTRIYSPTTGQLVNVAASDGGTIDLAYDGKLLLSTTWTGVVSGNVSHTWNSEFRMNTQSVNGDGGVAYTYDPDGLITGAGALTIARDPTSGLISGSTLGAVTDAEIHNSFGERTSYIARYNGQPIFQAQTTPDQVGRVVDRTETVDGQSHAYHYAYDAAGRLQTVTVDGVSAATYAYDQNGNRLSRTTPGGTESGSYDAQDRLLTYGKFSYTYGAAGELATKTDTTTGRVTTYSYDSLGNLRSVALPDGRFVEYVIDGMNRRIGKKMNGVLTRGWLYEGRRPVAELDGSGSVIVRYVYGSAMNAPAYVVAGGRTYRFVSDAVGTPRRVVDVATGTVAESMQIDEFGRTVTDSQPAFQSVKFAGGLGDPDTGLIRFGARDYDPEVGRWTSPDPIRFRGGDANLYVYVKNDPLNMVDGTGREISVSSPQLDVVLAELATNPDLAPFIEEINSSIIPVEIGAMSPAPAGLIAYGGAATIADEMTGGVMILIDWDTVQKAFQDCGVSITLEQVLAHELGHAYDYIYAAPTQTGASVSFENVLRDVMRLSEDLPCKCGGYLF
ncbi:MAG TPA: RHS repeat-associated core domain-containing protein, partial [Polyangia bacterium]|nr:RHS repeat-associated core domain-containing protein [Polyangia bacterium]